MKYEVKKAHDYSQARNPRKTLNGYTLIELLVTMAIGSVLLSVVTPGISALNQKDRQTAVVNSFVATLNAARSEAINRNARMTVCQSDNGYECGTAGWDKGWVVFTDSGVPGEVDEGDTVLHFSEPLPDDIRLSSSKFNTYISYFSDGTSNDSGSFELCNSRDQSAVKSICISAAGRTTIGTEECRGEEVSCL
jgi:type IV fimbrial biogenesis protein FimT